MDRKRRAQRTRALLVVALLAAAAGVGAYATHLLRRSELQTVDARFSIRGRQRTPVDVVLVLIDDATFAELTRAHLRSEFPFPRAYEGRVIDNLRRAGASTIGLDIEFAHPTDEADDNALFESLARDRGHTVLAATEVGRGGSTEVLGGTQPQREAGTRAAEAILLQDSDGSTRRLGYSLSGLQSFPVVTAELATGKRISPSLFEGGTVPIDFAGPPGTFTSISFSSVLQGAFDPNLVRGKTVIVGASAPVLQDVHTTATSGASAMSGPEVMADATETLLHGVPLRTTPGWVDVALILLLGSAVPLGSLRTRRWRALIDALALAVVFSVAVQVAFDSGLIVSYVYPLLALALGTLGTFGVLYLRETIERERVRDLFSRFVPAAVVDEVLTTADENARLAAVERDCTVLFSDLRGFTGFSEALPAARVIEVVNRYLQEMSAAILDAGGTLVAYMGDGIFAVFGAPLEQDDHADRAVAVAREMIGPRLEHFNAWIAQQGYQHRFEMGVGVNSGPVMAGNVGSDERMEYAAIGDTTNTASRLEAMTKEVDAMLFIADSTRERMRSGRELLTFLGEFPVRGRTGKLTVWTAPPLGATPAGEGVPTAADAQSDEPLGATTPGGAASESLR